MNDIVPSQSQSMPSPIQNQPQNMGDPNTNSNKKAILIIGILFFILFLAGGVSYMVSRYLTLRKIANLPIPEEKIVEKKPLQDADSTTASGSATFTIIDPNENVKGIKTDKTIFLESNALLDGYMSSEKSGSIKTDIRVGFDTDTVTRGFITFDLIDLPPGINVTKATLRVFIVKITGDPTGKGGKLFLDHLTYGNTLEQEDYALPALLVNAQTFPTRLKSDWYELDVTDLVKDDTANGRIRSQYRIHFEKELSDNKSTGDYIYFEAQENSLGTTNTPELVITYN